jgi:hypothetical protein
LIAIGMRRRSIATVDAIARLALLVPLFRPPFVSSPVWPLLIVRLPALIV